MNDRDQLARLSKLQESGDNEECWKEFYSEDIVRQSSQWSSFRLLLQSPMAVFDPC